MICVVVGTEQSVPGRRAKRGTEHMRRAMQIRPLPGLPGARGKSSDRRREIGAGSSNGRTADSGSVREGSNPSPAAIGEKLTEPLSAHCPPAEGFLQSIETFEAEVSSNAQYVRN